MKSILKVLVVFALLIAPAGAAELFVDVPGGEKALSSVDPAVVRARAVRVSFDALLDDGEMLSPEPAERLTMTLWPGLTVEAAYDADAAEGVSDRFAWVGRLTGRDDGQVVILASGGQLVGSVRTAEGTFRIRPDGTTGLHVVEEVDIAGQPACAEPLPGPDVPFDFGEERLQKAATDNGSTFDLLVVYTPAARQLLTALGSVDHLVNLSVAEGNVAFANSGIVPRIRLVHMAEIAYEEKPPYEDLGDLLFKAANPADGVMDEIHTLRDRFKADFVQLITRSREGACGIAFLMRGSNNRNFAPLAFGVTSSLCLAPSVTLIHEIGHNLGSNHAPGDPLGQGAFSYSLGFKSPVSNFHTVMAYTCTGGCPQVLHFSNPQVRYQGEVTGSNTQNNAQSINNIRTVAANFRNSNAAGGVCAKKKSTFKGCKGGPCKICAEKIADYPNYLANHPACVVNDKCKGGFVKCSVSCPAPTEADR